jgi:hypothetical protein
MLDRGHVRRRRSLLLVALVAVAAVAAASVGASTPSSPRVGTFRIDTTAFSPAEPGSNS